MTENGKNWHAGQLKFMAWLALPKELREPKTQGEFAETIGYHETTLSRWKQLPGWDEDQHALSISMIGDYTADVLHALAREAVKGSVQHIKLFLEVVKIYREQHGIEVRAPDLIGIVGVDYRTGLAALAPGSIQDSDTPGEI